MGSIVSGKASHLAGAGSIARGETSNVCCAGSNLSGEAWHLAGVGSIVWKPVMIVAGAVGNLARRTGDEQKAAGIGGKVAGIR